jgi:glycosyltransferase involved in cell wall biosynthesis
MKILIFANAESIWTKNYYDYVLADKEYDVYIANYFPDKQETRDEWSKRNVTYIDMENEEKPKSIPFLRRYIYLLKFLSGVKKYGKFDIIHLLFVGIPRSRCVVVCGRKRGTKTIFTFMGSDLYRADESKIKALESFLGKVDHITIMGSKMESHFREKYGNKYDNSLRKMFFGVDIFDFIDKSLKKDKEELREKFGIEKGLITVAVGYNANPAMQHRKAIEAILALPDTIKQKLCVILQMTYGYNNDLENYIKELKSLLTENNLKYIFLTDFLSNEVLADLRIITDIFIHPQISDAFSATIQEFLYSGTTVLNPIWIKYQELIANDIKFIEYNDFDDLAVRLKKYFENPEDYKTNSIHNLKVLT